MQNGVQTYKSSRFIAPFYGQNINKVKVDSDFDRTTISTVYLSKFVDEFFRDKDGICQKYILKDSGYGRLGFPDKNSQIILNSNIPFVVDTKLNSFSINSVSLYIFSTGIGFIEMEVVYPDIALKEIVDCSYCICNSFINEHDGFQKTNLLDYYVMKGDKWEFYSLKNAFINIVNLFGTDVELFPNSKRMRLNAFHNFICDVDGDTNRYIELLKRSLHTKGQVVVDGACDYASADNQKWGISSNCVVSIVDNCADDLDFFQNVFWENVYKEYYLLFLLVLHEREILLKCNQLAVANRKKPTELIGMKKMLIELEILFRYNTMSTESSYQEFYEALSEMNKLENLETDIKEVIDNVEEFMVDRKEKKTNAILTAIAFLAIVSVVCDGIAVADRIASNEPFGMAHLGVIGFITFVFVLGLFFFIKKE